MVREPDIGFEGGPRRDSGRAEPVLNLSFDNCWDTQRTTTTKADGIHPPDQRVGQYQQGGGRSLFASGPANR